MMGTNQAINYLANVQPFNDNNPPEFRDFVAIQNQWTGDNNRPNRNV